MKLPEKAKNGILNQDWRHLSESSNHVKKNLTRSSLENSNSKSEIQHYYRPTPYKFYFLKFSHTGIGCELS
jgi:hypothetical protein